MGTLGIGELAVLVAVVGVVLIALAIGLWVLRKTVSMVKRLVLAGVVLAMVVAMAVGSAVAIVWFNHH